MDNDRHQALTLWANELLDHLLPAKKAALELQMVSGDASFRRYFRMSLGDDSFIVVDAPPEHEDNHAFVRISNMMLGANITVPKVYSVDYEQGFMLLVDLGDQLYLDTLLVSQKHNDLSTPNRLYEAALRSLVELQSKVDKQRLEPYSKARLITEMQLFPHWLCGELFGMALEPGELAMLERSFAFLAEAVTAQPQVAVHRDYHSRNLMILNIDKFAESAGPGIIDFQDAVSGAYTYDLVSLLRDCYIAWPQAQVEQWAGFYLSQAHSKGLLGEVLLDTLLRDMDLAGLQRNLKVMGIFARLNIRDNKTQYLADIPLVIRYFLDVSAKYRELDEMRTWFAEKVMPRAKDILKLEF
ncbi:MAG: aminoglycoside/choline kinase family phosphotransferase [Pseudohongiellaceae bacterium]|jgi:aminoglycoside/choline kinase family phosphotransferase